MTSDERIAFEERAAIMEYDGGLARPEAERLARKFVEGREEQAEQIELDLGRQEFRRDRRRLFGDY